MRLPGARTVSRRFPGFCHSFSVRRCQQATAGSHHGSKRKATSLISAVMLAPGLPMRPFFGDTIPNSGRLALPQQCLQRVGWVTDAPFPFVEYLANRPLFTDYREELDAQDCDVDVAQAPIISTRMRLASEGMHHGTFCMEPVSRTGRGHAAGH